MKKIKVLTATPVGLEIREGISTVILDYFSRFNKEIFDLDIIASNSHDYKLVREFQKAGINIQYLPSRRKNTFMYIRGFAKLFHEKQYDILYVHGSSAIMSVELLIAKLYGCKVRIAHSHNTRCGHEKMDKLLRPVFNNLYTGALACGEEAGKWLFRNRTFEIIKNGRDVDIYRFDKNKRNDMRKKLGISDDMLLIGHVGNFNIQKNQKFLIYMFKELIKLHSNSKLYLIGTGKTKTEIEDLAEQLNLSESIVFTGSINNVADMLQAMDIMVLPSLYEGLPLSVIEWQIAALPCLISDSITTECSYTNLVYFESLESGYKTWAKRIVELSSLNRAAVADTVVRLTCENGFDINQNVESLQKYFLHCYDEIEAKK